MYEHQYREGMATDPNERAPKSPPIPDDLTAPERLEPLGIRDLSDFCLKWPDLREELQRRLRAEPGEERTEAIIGWLVLLADRACLDDTFHA